MVGSSATLAFRLSWRKALHQQFQELAQIVPDAFCMATDVLVDHLVMSFHDHDAEGSGVWLIPKEAYEATMPARRRRKQGGGGHAGEDEDGEEDSDDEEEEEEPQRHADEISDVSEGCDSVDSGADSDIIEDLHAPDEECKEVGVPLDDQDEE